jgi:hypothetical protein
VAATKKAIFCDNMRKGFYSRSDRLPYTMARGMDFQRKWWQMVANGEA